MSTPKEVLKVSPKLYGCCKGITDPSQLLLHRIMEHSNIDRQQYILPTVPPEKSFSNDDVSPPIPGVILDTLNYFPELIIADCYGNRSHTVVELMIDSDDKEEVKQNFKDLFVDMSTVESESRLTLNDEKFTFVLFDYEEKRAEMWKFFSSLIKKSREVDLLRTNILSVLTLNGFENPSFYSTCFVLNFLFTEGFLRSSCQHFGSSTHICSSCLETIAKHITQVGQIRFDVDFLTFYINSINNTNYKPTKNDISPFELFVKNTFCHLETEKKNEIQNYFAMELFSFYNGQPLTKTNTLCFYNLPINSSLDLFLNLTNGLQKTLMLFYNTALFGAKKGLSFCFIKFSMREDMGIVINRIKQSNGGIQQIDWIQFNDGIFKKRLNGALFFNSAREMIY
ncbi:hypothetical protein EIN_056240 [Entamoeba invadens IP1]|uniref:hypothetical protein n=1 Tax=Entamoeba invadens IP1 TaxID=370355 RepID=UPI0002C3FAED|nr:hypothetical protein EIN_056240 [Entamoeba invadens IP1]ELP93249.1 hypothetical protein EIN_056240 [Entamoeba invadens IP1]|eukprot:XP_004260020.1 hypothetical protein EIN_056240 [Entamoeba invadens IP1]